MALWKTLVGLALVVGVVGCGQSATVPATQAKKEVKSDVLLSEQPADAKPVADACEAATDGAAITILGRIGGAENPWVEGRAAFTIVDPKLQPCKPDEGCPTPWDYCCSTDQLPGNRALVKVVDSSGDTVEQDARKLLGVKELQTVVVKGTAKRDEAGNLTVLATGIYVVPDTK
jgi:hypothetical protein